MSKITIKDLKQDLVDTIDKIDKEKVTISDLKTLAETVGVLSTIKENQTDYMDVLMKMSATGFGYKPSTVSDLKGVE